MNSDLLTKLQKILALTTSPVEGEAQAATAMLQKFLQQHNLDMADLEKRGHAAPAITEEKHDLGKAAFKWKLRLASLIAAHFFCESLICDRTKEVIFLGRPDNVQSLRMLYTWLIDQIRRISAEARKAHQTATNEHVDPLRWQVNFGMGLVDNLGARLEEIRQKREADEAAANANALVIHHASEISDYLEQTRGIRKDGQKTQRDQEWDARYAEMCVVERTKREARAAQMKTDRAAMSDVEFWAKYPDQKPLDAKAQAKVDRDWQKQQEKWRKQDEARQLREWEKEQNLTPEQKRQRRQAADAAQSGGRAAKDVNLEPFLTGPTRHTGPTID